MNQVTTIVFPAIVEKFKHMRVREVTMQQDGARCHTQKKKDGFEAMTQKLTPPAPSSALVSRS